jgi:hypothetical protein
VSPHRVHVSAQIVPIFENEAGLIAPTPCHRRIEQQTIPDQHERNRRRQPHSSRDIDPSALERKIADNTIGAYETVATDDLAGEQGPQALAGPPVLTPVGFDGFGHWRGRAGAIR